MADASRGCCKTRRRRRRVLTLAAGNSTAQKDILRTCLPISSGRALIPPARTHALRWPDALRLTQTRSACAHAPPSETRSLSRRSARRPLRARLAFCHHTHTAPSHTRKSPLPFSLVTDTTPSSLASPDARRLHYMQQKRYVIHVSTIIVRAECRHAPPPDSPPRNQRHCPNAPACPYKHGR